jgi:branched-chain amino acid transport system permease protein
MMQLFVNGVLSASVFAVIAVGFVLIYIVSRFFHFAHGVILTSGAFFCYAVTLSGAPLSLAIAVGVVGAAILGTAMELLTYRPLRHRGATPLVLLLASLGLYIACQNTISLIFGDAIRTLRTWPVREGLPILGARVTPVQLTIIGSAVLLYFVTWVFLKKTRAGRAFRAVASDPELARVSGIRSERVVLAVFAWGSVLASLAGILIALDVDMTPQMGMRPLMMGVVAVIVGGTRSIWGPALGALLLGFAQHFGTLCISSAWQDAIAFAVLIMFLLVRPHGIVSKLPARETL